MATQREELERLRALKAQRSTQQAPVRQPASQRSELERLRALKAQQQTQTIEAPQSVAQQQSGPASLSPQLNTTPAQPLESPVNETFGDRVVGALDTAKALSTGALGQIAGGVGGLLFGGLGEVSDLIGVSKNRDFADRANDALKTINDFVTQEASTPEGKANLKSIGDATKKVLSAANTAIAPIGSAIELSTGQGFEQAKETFQDIRKQGPVKTAAERTFEETGSPLAATVAGTAVAAIPEFIGGRGLFKSRQKAPEQPQSTPEQLTPEQQIQQAKEAQLEKQQVKQPSTEKKEPVEEDLLGQQAAREAQIASEATGVRVFPAQRTLNTADLEKQSLFASLPAGAVKARRELSAQNREASEAVDNFLNDLAPPLSSATAGPRFRTAANKVIDNIKQVRSEKASPLYKASFVDSPTVDLKPVFSSINELLKTVKAGSATGKALNKVKDLIKPEINKKKKIKGEKQRVTVTPLDLETLHNSRLEIAEMIAKGKLEEGSLGPTTKRKLNEVMAALSKQMDQASSQYKAARDKFSKLSPNVERIENSLIGRIANFDDTQLKNISSTIFNPAETNPLVLANAKKAISSVDKGAWDALVRTEIQKRLGKVRADLDSTAGTAATENVPSQLFNKLFGSKERRDLLFEAVDGQAKTNLKYIETVLRRASKGRPGGSQTSIREEFLRDLHGGAAAAVADFLVSPSSVTTTAIKAGKNKRADRKIKKETEVLLDSSFERKAKAFTNVLTDSSFQKEMIEIKKLSPSSGKAKRLMTDLLNSALVLLPTAGNEENQ